MTDRPIKIVLRLIFGYVCDHVLGNLVVQMFGDLVIQISLSFRKFTIKTYGLFILLNIILKCIQRCPHYGMNLYVFFLNFL